MNRKNPETTPPEDLLAFAERFINSTSSHLFLTGKAGTGKTTFLRELAASTHKQFVIVAPTGIAALNAGGVTIHSQFLFPFGSFVPVCDPAGHFGTSTHFYTQHTLSRSHPLNSVRKQVLRATDLLIIDEVSMLRADLLDAIDYRMRSAKANHSRSFGGAQVLMIGDLYQLPPIVKDDEWAVLQNYYRSMHFFEALALKRDGMVCIELQKIFRQKDSSFISILNRLRSNTATAHDIAALNKHYQADSQAETERGTITITTHNYKADAINARELAALPGTLHRFRAETHGDFPEKLYPMPDTIELKEGAQVMFVRNDTSEDKAYYNGKLARVSAIQDEFISVAMDDGETELVLRKEEWSNKEYVLKEETRELEEEVRGTFEQYPVKLAWAVTVHKSQGLTFDRAIIDVGQAFAPGQVYVALSRLRSLEGLILRTRITPGAISTDQNVLSFSKQWEDQSGLSRHLEHHQYLFLERILDTSFDFSGIERQLDYFQQTTSGKLVFDDDSMRQAIGKLQANFKTERNNTTTFRKQLRTLLHQQQGQLLIERIERGSAYYRAFMEKNLGILLKHHAEVERFTRSKTYRNALSEIDTSLMKALDSIEKAAALTESILTGRRIAGIEDMEHRRHERRMALYEAAQRSADENPKLGKRKRATGTGKNVGKPSARAKKSRKQKKPKGQTYRESYALAKEGKHAAEIAKLRGLALSTIEAHLARGIGEGELDISDFVSKEAIEELSAAMSSPHKGINGIYHALEGKYSYNTIRMVLAHVERHKS